MTELEKLDAGLEYCFFDDGVAGRKARATQLCQEFNRIDVTDFEKQEATIKKLFGSTGEHVYMMPDFHCDDGTNIHVGEEFHTNYNVIILDIMPVHIGDYVMIGPNTLISTVFHPLSPKKRMEHMAQGKPVHIGSYVWIGANCTILPGVTIGNNVVVAAGSVVTKDVPDNCVVAGVPARVVKEIENDVDV